MRTKARALMCFMALCCTIGNASAQIEGDNLDDDLDLYYEEEEEPALHKEYKNAFSLQYLPTGYHFQATPHLLFHGVAFGWNRLFQVTEKNPFFVEMGAQLNYAHGEGDAEHTNASYNLMALVIPINITYKLYFCKDKDWAIAPVAGINFRANCVGKERIDGKGKNIIDNGEANSTGADWKRCYLGWQAGLRIHAGRFYLGATYGQNFPEKKSNTSGSKDTNKKIVRYKECAVHLGLNF